MKLKFLSLIWKKEQGKVYLKFKYREIELGTNSRIETLGTGGVRHIQIHTSEPLVPDPICFEWKLLLTSCKSPGSDKIPLELLPTEGQTLHSVVCTLVNSLITFNDQVCI